MTDIDRRALIKKAAVVGAVGWTAPLIFSTAASANSVGTPKCQPKVSFIGGSGFKGHNNGSCGAYMILTINPTSTPVCPCTGGTEAQFISWSKAGGPGGTALYQSLSETGNGVQSLPFAPTPNVSNEITLFRQPDTGSNQPRTLQAGTYTVTACVLVRCCRSFGNTAHSAYRIEQLRFTVTVGTPCGPSTVSVSSALVGGTTPASCSGAASLVTCP